MKSRLLYAIRALRIALEEKGGFVNLAEWDVAYILGALTPEERLEFECYLASHPDRAAELTELEAKYYQVIRLPRAARGKNFVPSSENGGHEAFWIESVTLRTQR